MSFFQTWKENETAFSSHCLVCLLELESATNMWFVLSVLDVVVKPPLIEL